MMDTLLQNFYQIKNKTAEGENKLQLEIELNPAHPVYQGHFPQIPIAPGVCLTQIIKEICESHLQQKLKMIAGRNIKFLALINPLENKDFLVKVEIKKEADGNYDCDASFNVADKAFMKFKGNFSHRN